MRIKSPTKQLISVIATKNPVSPSSIELQFASKRSYRIGIQIRRLFCKIIFMNSEILKSLASVITSILELY